MRERPLSALYGNSQFKVASKYLNECGFSVMPIPLDGSKQPRIPWKKWQSELPTENELKGWFAQPMGIGIICGAISGGLVALDIEVEVIYDLFRQKVQDAGLIDELDRCPVIRTPHNGRHVWCLTNVAMRSQILAKDLDIPTPKADGLIVETRGDGGFVVGPGSPAKVHETGVKYEVLNKGWLETGIEGGRLADHVFNSFVEILRTFDKPKATSNPVTTALVPKPKTVFDTTEDSFTTWKKNRTWDDLLIPDGWTKTGGEFFHDQYGAGCQKWKRPGKNQGCSATTSADILYVFSSSVSLPQETALDKVAYLAHSRYAGDMKAAAAEIRRQVGVTKHKETVFQPMPGPSSAIIQAHDPDGRYGLSMMTAAQKQTVAANAKAALTLQQGWSWYLARGDDGDSGFIAFLKDAGIDSQAWNTFKTAGKSVTDQIQPGTWVALGLEVAKSIRTFKPTQWLIQGILPAGKSTILSAPPKVGKSSAILAISARLMQGLPVLPGVAPTSPIEVMWLVSEDQLADQIEPALAAEGITRELQDERFHFVSGKTNGSPIGPNDRDLILIRAYLADHPGIKMVVVDTLAKFFAGSEGAADSMSPEHSRRIVGALQSLAEDTGVAVLIIAHDTKEIREGVTRIAGSIQIAATARHILGLERLESGETGLRPVASNLPGVRTNLGLAFQQEFLTRREAEAVAGRTLEEFDDFQLMSFQRQEIRAHDFSQDAGLETKKTTNDVFPSRPSADLVNENRDLVARALGSALGGLTKKHLIEKVMTGKISSRRQILTGMTEDGFLTAILMDGQQIYQLGN
jgi:RecA-family ATPase